jgi:hypothetical protein
VLEQDTAEVAFGDIGRVTVMGYLRVSMASGPGTRLATS